MASNIANAKKCVLVFYVFSKMCGQASAQTSQGEEGLALNFHSVSCPAAEIIARSGLQAALRKDPTVAAALLRVSFHDCQVDGCDASILLRSSAETGVVEETISEKNFGVRRLEVLDDIKATLEAACPLTVSCADIIQMAARDAVSLDCGCNGIHFLRVYKSSLSYEFFWMSGGPYIPILTGRRDGMHASNIRADEQLPASDISVDQMISMFSLMNISLQDSVALLGAHTLGVGHCMNFKSRLSTTVQPKMPAVMWTMLRMVCGVPAPLEKVAFAPNDLTNFVFDSQYFSNILLGRGLLPIDASLATDPRTAPYVLSYSKDQPLFFQRFLSGFLQLSRFRVLTGTSGEIRSDCKFLNSQTS